MLKKKISRLNQIITGGRDGQADEWLSLEAGFSRLEQFVHFWVLVWKSFVRNRCPVRASALSYSTLLALIPMLAVALSVTSSLLKSEGENEIYQSIDKLVATIMPPDMPGTNTPDDFLDFDMDFPVANVAPTNAPSGATNSPAITVAAQKVAAKKIRGFIQNTRSGTLGVVGMILLVSVAVTMLSRVEETFNDIWGVTRGRNWFVRIVQYWAVITLGPLLLAGALAMAGGPHFQTTKNIVGGTLVGRFIFQLLPLVVVWVTFASFYKLVPNTKVHFGAAMVGGVIAGTAWFANNVFGFLYISRVVSNSKIYGGLALVPVFMMGLYLSWLLLLFGAQVAYAFQNRAAYLQDKLAENVNQRGREFVALRLMTCIGQRFHRGLPPATIAEISTELGVPSRLAQQVLQTLLAARLVVEVSRGGPAYSPARPLEAINAHHVLMAMRATVGQELVTRDEPVRAEVLGEFARIQEAEKLVASSVTMLALVNRAEARLELSPPPQDGKEVKMVTTLAAPASSDFDAKPAPLPAAAPVIELVETETPVTATPKPVLKTQEVAAAKSTLPKPRPEISPTAPTAISSTDQNESFPL
jgi:membrane protein